MCITFNQATMAPSYVLILDDNDISLKIAYRMFTTLGWAVIRCRTADMAMQVFLDNEITLVLCDFMLGKETAVRVVKELREFEKESMAEQPVPIIGFSSHARARNDFLAAGGTAFYEKPLTKANVMEMVSLYSK